MSTYFRDTAGLRPDASEAASGEIVGGLLDLLHRNAPAEAFAALLAKVDALPDALPEKPGLIERVRMATAVRNRIEMHEQRERGMLAVIESAQDLSGRLDLQELLKAITTRARNLMGAHLCWLTVVDAQSGTFQVVAADGAISLRTSGMTAGRNLGVAGVVTATRLPFSTPDYLHDTRFVHDPALDETFRDEGIAALVGVPLIRENQVIGLLFVADRYHRSHTALDVSILCTLATHAALAIGNARAFAEAQEALHRADRAHSELERHVRDVQGATEAHEQLTSLLAKGAPLGVLCASIARQLGGDILVLDEAGQVIGIGAALVETGTAASAYAAGGEHSLALSRALRESRKAGRSVPAYEHHGELCRAIAVIGGNDMLGAVLLFRGEDLGGVALRTFERSSNVIGVVLLSQERAEAEKSRDMSSLLRTLIAPRQGEPRLSHERAARFGLDLSQPLVLLVVDFQQSTTGFWSRRLRADILTDEQVLDDVDGALVLICSAVRAYGAIERFKAFFGRQTGHHYLGVLSRPVASAAEVPAVYAATRRGLSVLGRLGMRSGIVAQHELALYSVLFETHDHASLTSFLHAVLGPLIVNDGKRGLELASTLLAYFDNNQNAKATASRLDLHVNTVRQRLASVAERLGPWSDASRALELHMALRLWNLCAADGSTKAVPTER
jgi:sugar diacid utilization regulator/GAF domain-containing protein